MATSKKQLMDVAKPGKSAADATTRPLIIKHGAMMRDPMVTSTEASASDTEPAADQKTSAPAAPKMHGAKIIKPLDSAEEKSEPEPSETPEESAVKKPEEAIIKKPIDIEKPVMRPKPVESAKKEPAKKPEPAVLVDDKPADDKKEEKSADTKDTSNAAVVDVIADQADVGKREKRQQDSEVAAMEATTQKLVEEKKYFLPIKAPRRTRFGRGLLGGLVVAVLLLAGAYAAVDAGLIDPGFDVPKHFIGGDDSAGTSQPAAPIAQPQTTPPIVAEPTAKLAQYTNKTLGVSFAYPENWGEVAVTISKGSISGSAATLAFSKQPLMAAGMLSKDYEEFGRDGECYLLLGIFPQSSLNAVKGQIKEGDLELGVDDPGYRATFHILKTTADSFVYEQFVPGPIGTGVCPGVSLVGYRTISATSNYTGIQFYWGGNAASRKAVAPKELDAYKADPNKYLSDTDRKAILAVVDSVK